MWKGPVTKTLIRSLISSYQTDVPKFWYLFIFVQHNYIKLNILIKGVTQEAAYVLLKY